MAVFEYDFYKVQHCTISCYYCYTNYSSHIYCKTAFCFCIKLYIRTIYNELFFPLEIEGFSYIRARLLAMQFDNPLPLQFH